MKPTKIVTERRSSGEPLLGVRAVQPFNAMLSKRLEDVQSKSSIARETVVFCDNLALKNRILMVEEPTDKGAGAAPAEVET